MNNPVADILKNWIPYKLEEGQCRWLYTADTRFTHPFFDETIGICRIDPINRHSRRPTSDLEIMKEWSELIDAAPVKALIFHVSRCGSTLLSQQLALDENNIALSEVPFLDELLRQGFRNKEEKKAGDYFKAALRFYSARRNGSEKAVYIKTDSWHLHFYAQLRELFPDLPFIILIRRPDEIIRSQRKMPGMQSVPGMIEPELFGFNPNELYFAEHDKHMAEVLATYYKAIQNIIAIDNNVLLCNYAEGMNNVFEKMAGFIGLNTDHDQLEKIKDRGNFHAKKPGEKFEEPPLNEEPPDFLKKAMKLYKELASNIGPHSEKIGIGL